MVDETIKIALKEKHGKLNFNSLLDFMEASGIEFKDRKLRGPMGIATYFCIYLDLHKIDAYNDKMLFFVILHEIAHYKRIARVGKEHIIKMLSLEDFEEFCTHVITEEIIADRYGCYVFYLLNKNIFPREATQRLDEKYRQVQYKHTAKHLFGQIQNNEENYKRVLESFLV
jgi:hypothetical protein